MSSINNFFNTLYRCTFAFDSNRYLTESNHVIDGFDEIAYHIANCVRLMWNDLSKENDKRAAILSTDLVYSSFNLNDDYPNEYKHFVEFGDEAPSVAYQGNDESLSYPIYFQLEWEMTDTRYAYIDYRDFDNSDTIGNICIHINVARFSKFTEKIFYLLISSISHELQHAFDMYVVPYNNPLDYGKRSLMMDVRDIIREMNLSKNDVATIQCLCTLFSKDEISGRLAELKSFINLVTKNKSICDEIFYDVAMREYEIPFKHLDHDSNEKHFTRNLLINFIARNEYIQRITRINLFHTVFEDLFSKPNRNELIVMIGYCLFNRGMLNLTFLSDEDKHKIKQTFKTINNINDVDDVVIDCVVDTMKSLFDDYVTTVNKTLMDNFENFYKTMNLNDIVVEAMNSTNEEIVLIPMND